MVLALLAALSAGTADFMYKKVQSAGVEAGPFYFAHAAAFMCAVGIYAWAFGHFRVNWPTILYSLGCSVLAFVSFYSMLLSVNRGEASITITLVRLSFAITAVLAILLLDEPLTLLKACGLISAVFVVGLFGFRSSEWSFGSLRQTTRLALLAMIALGVQRFVYKVALDNGTDGPTLLFLQAALVFLMTFVLLPGRRVDKPVSTIGYASLCACLQVTAVLLTLAALSLFEASVVVPIAQMSFVLTTLLAAWRLGERMSVQKIMGTGLAVLSVILLGFGS